jgi:hypothetical protein
VTGVLDMSEALRLADSLSLTVSSDGAELSVDLRSAREAHDAAVVALARALGLRNGSILGLSRHHERLLGYVGQLTGEPAP